MPTPQLSLRSRALYPVHKTTAPGLLVLEALEDANLTATETQLAGGVRGGGGEHSHKCSKTDTNSMNRRSEVCRIELFLKKVSKLNTRPRSPPDHLPAYGPPSPAAVLFLPRQPCCTAHPHSFLLSVVSAVWMHHVQPSHQGLGSHFLALINDVAVNTREHMFVRHFHVVPFPSQELRRLGRTSKCWEEAVSSAGLSPHLVATLLWSK